MLAHRASWLCLFFIQTSLWSYELNHFHWGHPVIELWTDSNELFTPLLLAMAEWNEVGCSPLRLRLSPNAKNQVFLKNTSEWTFESQALAVTSRYYIEETASLRKVEIHVNLGKYQWNATDYKNILLHELGHVLGLEHSKDYRSVMHAYGQIGDTERHLTADDRLGACALTLQTGSNSDRNWKKTQYELQSSGCAQSKNSFGAWHLLSCLLVLRWLARRANTRQCACRLATEKNKPTG